ncbi:DUF2203 domain-containing protein [candidate division KSB1 bacterium]|nr:DUF2203 domain-containing protein [candidate division KSB1 bacterium]
MKKYYTPVEASKTLPLVKRIVYDILEIGQRIGTLNLMQKDGEADNPEVEELVDKLNGYLAELEQIGCYFKDWNFTIGLVDFPAKINGKEVLLCWRSDEDNLKYYHDIEAGFAGRKLIPREYFSES